MFNARHIALALDNLHQELIDEHGHNGLSYAVTNIFALFPCYDLGDDNGMQGELVPYDNSFAIKDEPVAMRVEISNVHTSETAAFNVDLDSCEVFEIDA